VAGLLSALLHGLVAALLLWRARARVVESIAAVPIEIELNEVVRSRPDRMVPTSGASGVHRHRAEPRAFSLPRVAGASERAPPANLRGSTSNRGSPFDPVRKSTD
jgi:hypothetical protein